MMMATVVVGGRNGLSIPPRPPQSWYSLWKTWGPQASLSNAAAEDGMGTEWRSGVKSGMECCNLQ